MSKRLTFFGVIGLMLLFSLTLTACEKERPIATPVSRATVAPARGTVAPIATSSVMTQTLPVLSGSGGQAASPAANPTVAVTTPQSVVVNPAATSSASSETSSSGNGAYVIQAGDTLGKIAAKFGTTMAELQRLNNISNPDLVVIGQTLVVPSGGASTSTTTTEGGQKYVVQSGDTLGRIAAKFGVTVAALQAANNIVDPDLISVGEELIIP